MRIQFGTQVKAVTSCWDREMENVFIGSDPLPFRTLYNRLCERGNVVFIHADAPWKKAQSGAFVRPFAGHRRRVFATGTAQLAQMSQCPILCCVYFLESDGTIVLEWGPLIRNADMEQGNVIDVMYRLIDRLEIAIGERPTQYIFEIGYDRRWNSKSKQWEDITD
jgi:lauroyl/myristoyl acyltransferase